MAFVTDAAAKKKDKEKPVMPYIRDVMPGPDSDPSITVKWDRCSDNVTAPENLRYRVYWRINEEGSEWQCSSPYLMDAPKDITQYTIKGLKADAEYVVSVVVTDEAGNNATSYTRHCWSTKRPPGKPFSSTPTQSTISVSFWMEAQNIWIYYKVLWRKKSSKSFKESPLREYFCWHIHTPTTYVIPDLDPGTEYVVDVVKCNEDGTPDEHYRSFGEQTIKTLGTPPSEPEQPATLTLEPKELTSGPNRNDQKVTISCTEPFYPHGSLTPDWLSVGGINSNNKKSHELTIAIMQNTGAERTGEITIKTTAGNVKLKVTQRAASSTPSATLTLDPKELTLEAKENGQFVTLSCNKPYHVDDYDKPDWLSASGSSAGYKDRQELWILAQKNPGAERTGEITIKTSEGNVKLKVTQRGASSTPSGTLTLDPMVLTMKYHRNEAEVTLSCDKEFSINQVVIDHLDWLSATGGSGLYKKHFIRITAQENPGAKRSGTVTFKTSEGEATLHVTQEAKSTAPPTLTLTPTTLTFAASGGASQSVAVKSSVEGWGVRLKDRTQDWLTVTPDAAAKTVTVTVKPNTGTKKRSAEVEVVSDAGLTRSFFVTQQGNRPPEAVSGLSLNPEAMTMGGSSGAVGFTLKSDKPWTVTADADWLHPGSTHGNAGTTYFRLRFDQNTTGAVRTGKLTFTTTDGKATKTFTLTQRVGSAKPKPSTPSEGTYDYDLAVNPESITLSGEGGGSSIDVVTHRLWAGSTADDWITLEKAVGRGDGSFDFTLAPNPSKEMRHGKITVRTEHGMDELTIAIHQQGQTGDIVLPGQVKVSGLTLDPATLVVDGDIASTLISALITPENAANKSLLWMSSNPAVASVSILGQTRSGVALLPQLRFAPDADDYALVTIAGKGKATITAATSDGSGIVARCEIEVRSTVGNVVPYAPAAKIYATPGTLHLTLPQATRVEIYTLLGIRLRTLDAPAGDTSVTLPRGLYIVRAGTAVQKVRIE